MSNQNHKSAETTPAAITSSEEENGTQEYRPIEESSTNINFLNEAFPQERNESKEIGFSNIRHSHRIFLNLLIISVIGVLGGALVETCQQYRQMREKYAILQHQFRTVDSKDVEIEKQARESIRQMAWQKSEISRLISQKAKAERTLANLQQMHQDLKKDYQVLAEERQTLKFCVADSQTVIKSIGDIKTLRAVLDLSSRPNLGTGIQAVQAFGSGEFSQVGTTLRNLFDSWHDPSGHCYKTLEIVLRP